MNFFKVCEIFLGVALVGGVVPVLAQVPPNAKVASGSTPELAVDPKTLADLQKATAPSLQNPVRDAAQTKAALKKKSDDDGPHRFELKASFIRTFGASDYRAALINPTTLGTPGAPPEMSFLLTLIEPKLVLFDDPSMRMEVRGAVPVRSLQAQSAGVASGTEFGGYSVGLAGLMFKHAEVELNYAAHQSSKLSLQDPSRDWGIGAFAVESQPPDGGMGLEARLGAEVSQSTSTSDVLKVSHGMTYGVIADLAGVLHIGRDSDLKIGVETAFHRVRSTQVAGLEEGGAGLVSVSPLIEYGITPEIHFGVRYVQPLVRPEGREYAFGNADMPGLFGRGFGVQIRGSAF